LAGSWIAQKLAAASRPIDRLPESTHRCPILKEGILAGKVEFSSEKIEAMLTVCITENTTIPRRYPA
jgi:hypothetical protein